jgi:hypothetical protein
MVTLQLEAQVNLELSRRNTDEEMLSMEASQAEKIPVIDVKRLNEF